MRISGLLWCHQGLMYPCKHFYVAITKVHIFRELSMETLAFFLYHEQGVLPNAKAEYPYFDLSAIIYPQMFGI